MFPTFKTKAEIPKGFEAMYEEKDGEWKVKASDAETELAKVTETLAKVRLEKKDAEKASTDATKRAADLQKELDAKKLTGDDLDKKTAELLATWKKDTEVAVAVVAKERDDALGKLRQVNLDDKAKAAFIAAGGRPERAAAALQLKKDRLDLADDALVVKDERGAVSTKTIADFWGKDVKTEMPEFFVGTKATGGGPSGGAGTGSTTTKTTFEEAMKNPLKLMQEANESSAAA